MSKDFSEIFKRIPFSYDEIELVGDSQFTVGFPEKFPDEFKKRVVAAAKSYVIGNISIDQTLKTYGHYWNLHEGDDLPSNKLLNEMVKCVRTSIDNTINRIHELHDLPDHVGLLIAGAALLRLERTFRSAILLQKSQMYFEGICINRLILEQLSWILSIHNLKDEKLFKINPTKSITNLTKLVLYAGKMYGLLSYGSHINPNLWKELIDFSDDKAKLTISSPSKILVNAYHLLLLADIFIIITEIIYRYHFTKLSSIHVFKEGVKIKKTREMSRTINKYYKTINKYAKVV